MIRRCYEKKCANYKHYGKKGVRVCKEWRKNYQNFLTWSLNNGWKPGLSIDKDKLGDGKLYSPKTCCWITMKENFLYTKKIKKYEVYGEILTSTQISKRYGIKKGTFLSRINSYGKSILEAINTPIRRKQ